MHDSEKKALTVFPPCLIDQVYPEMGLALVALLNVLGYEVTVREGSSCCGQPAFNSGYSEPARTVARSFCDTHQSDGEVLCPSGSCAAMVRVWYPEILEESAKCNVIEFSEFILREKLGEKISGKLPGKIAYHASCHTVRELKVDCSLKELFPKIEGFEEVRLAPVCCGFGGLFCARFPEVAGNISTSRIEMAEAQQVDLLVSNDPGCIMQLRTQAQKNGSKLRIMHLAEFAAQAMGLLI